MRIAHISDFHLRHHLPGNSLSSKRRGRFVADLLAVAVNEINALTKDLLAVTGDLVDYPLYGLDDPDLQSRGLEDLRLVKEILGRATCPIVTLYGNHDHPAHFRDLFGDDPLERDIEGHRILTFLDEEGEGHHPERVGAERSRFEQVLDDSDGRPQVHLQHYQVWPHHETGYPHSYRDAPTLKNAIVASKRVCLVLSGHYHGGYNLFEEDGVAFSTSTAFCEFPHAYRTYDLTEGAITERVYTLADRTTRKPAFLLDHDGLLALLADSASGVAALRRSTEAGYLLLGIVRQRLEEVRPVLEIEISCDRLHDKARDQDILINGLVSRFAKDETDGEFDPSVLTQACEAMVVSPAHSHLFTRLDNEATAGREAGIGRIHRLDEGNAIESFCAATDEICGVGS